jgi:cytochrome c biogenesis protein CcmG/thiol:disulfide interchange protein DsbE
MNRWHIVFLTILVLGGGWLWLSRVPAPAQAQSALWDRGPQPAIGFPAPDFTLATLEGEELKLSQLRGRPVVLNFWATWCEPCKRELPALQATAKHYGENVTIIGVDQGEDAAVVKAYLSQYTLIYPIVLDTDFAISGKYNVVGLPTTFFIDSTGIVRHLWVGEMNRITLAEGIAKASSQQE